MVSKQNMEILVVLFAGAFVLVAVVAPILPGFSSLGGTQAGVVGGPTDNSQGNSAVFCSKSNGGINFDVKGVCTDFKTGNEYTDYCTGNTITEYYCSTDGCKAVDFRCPFGCSQGRCLPQLQS